MQKFGKYLTWFLFAMAILGGFGTIANLFTGDKEEETPKVVEENHEAEALAKQFAKEWLTIGVGQTLEDRTQKLSKYLKVNAIKWEVPTVQQEPVEINVQKVERNEKDKQTTVTLDVKVVLTNNSGTIEEEESQDGGTATVNTKKGNGTVNDNATNSSINPNTTDSNKENMASGVTLKRFYLQVTIIEDENLLKVMSEPVMLPAPQNKAYAHTFEERPEAGEIAKESEQFVKNFMEAYFKGEASVDIQPYLDKSYKTEPLGNFETLSSVEKITIYFRGQDKEKEPTEKYYFALAEYTVQDPDSKLLYSQKMRVYFTLNVSANQPLVTYVLRN